MRSFLMLKSGLVLFIHVNLASDYRNNFSKHKFQKKMARDEELGLRSRSISRK